MNVLNFKTFYNFLSRNKLYTIVNILGFAISLMFILLLSIYVKQEITADSFHKNKDRIYLFANSPTKASSPNPLGEYVKNVCPEVESYIRVSSSEMNVKYENAKYMENILFADSLFFNVFSFDILEGNPSDVLATNQSAVITQSFANKIFHNENPIGKPLLINDQNIIITGIAKDFPSNTQFPQSALIVNYNMIGSFRSDDILNDWGNCSYTTYFLEKKGANLNAKSDFLLDLFKKDFWLYKNGFANEVIFMPLEDVYFSDLQFPTIDIKTNSKSLVYTYFAITLLILIVAILNYINLSVSQAGARGKEAAIKKLLGSSRKKIFAQFISESILMTAFAAILGITFAFFTETFFSNVLNTNLNLIQQIDFTNISIVIVTIFIIGLFSGLFPAFVVSRFEPIEVVKGTLKLKVKTFYSKILISFQYIVAISLLICSAFLIKQTNYLKNYNLGFNKDKIIVMSNVLESEKLNGLKNELFRIPEVANVSFSAGTPLDGGNNNSFEYNGEPVSLQIFQVDSAFFDIYGIKLLPFDTVKSNSIWLNQLTYNILQPDSISHRIFGEEGDVITGIISDFNYKSLHESIGTAMVIFHQEMQYPWTISIKINNNADVFKTADKIKKVYYDYSGGADFEFQFANDIIQKRYENESKISKILISFSVLTIIILMMGILAMSLYYVRQKEKEIAIRKINGANEKGIMCLININFLKWIVIASIISIPLTYYIMQKWVEKFAYKISLDWWVFVLAIITVALLSAIFVSIQSWKVATKNPINSLKRE